MEQLLEELLEASQPFTKNGKLADYIPELLKADPNALGIYVMRPDGKRSWAGDCSQKFTIQSVVKPILLLLALMDNGIEAVRSQVGVEATGKPFDAINAINTNEKALYSEHLNPMVNMGAILMCTLIRGDTYEEKFNRLLELTRKLADNPDIVVDEAVYQSEKATGSKNRALAYLLYFRACSIQVTCKDLARIGAVLANRGRAPGSDERLFPAKFAQYVNAILLTCGMYDGSGDFAVRVGIPAKSGVGGGIMAVVPTRMGIGIFGPALDKNGNSVAGIRLLEEFSHRMYLSIF